MKAFYMGVASLAVFASFAAPAPADTGSVHWPSTPREAKNFVQDIPGDAWAKIMSASISLKFFIGKPIVAVFNPSDDELVNVVCDGKWSLVGPTAYLKDKAPRSIPPHTVGFVPTDGFDGYCKTSIIGITEGGEQVTGALSVPGDFTNSTAIYFPAGSSH